MTTPTDTTPEPGKTPVIAIVALLAGATAMGISPVFVRFAEVGAFASAFWRVGLAVPVLFLWAAWAERGGGTPLMRAPGRAVILAGLLFAGDLFFWHLSILNTTIANATLLATMAPVWVVLGSGLLIGERVTSLTVGGLALCLAGGAILLGASYSLTPERLAGDFYGVATSLFFGAYFLAVRFARRTASAARIMAWSTAVTAAALFVVAVTFEDRLLPETLSGYAALAALALLAHVGGQGLLAYALGHLPAAFSSLVIFVEALVAALFGRLLLGEAVGLHQYVGGAAILIGIYVARPRPEPPPAKNPQDLSAR